MPHYLFIVAPDKPETLADLQRQFKGNPDVEVIVDRRRGDRRVHQAPQATERRLGERRGQRGGNSRVRGIGGDPGLPALIVELAPDTASPAR